MPNALPLSVFLLGMLKRLAMVLKKFSRYWLAVFVWSILTPQIAYRIFFYLSGITLVEETEDMDEGFKIVLHNFLGTSIMLFCVGFVMSVIFFRDAIATHQTLDEVQVPEVDDEPFTDEEESEEESEEEAESEEENVSMASASFTLKSPGSTWKSDRLRRAFEAVEERRRSTTSSRISVYEEDFARDGNFSFDSARLEDIPTSSGINYNVERREERRRSEESLMERAREEERRERGRAILQQLLQEQQESSDSEEDEIIEPDENDGENLVLDLNQNENIVNRNEFAEVENDLTAGEIFGVSGSLWNLVQYPLIVIGFVSVLCFTFISIPFVSGSTFLFVSLPFNYKLFKMWIHPWIQLLNIPLSLNFSHQDLVDYLDSMTSPVSIYICGLVSLLIPFLIVKEYLFNFFPSGREIYNLSKKIISTIFILFLELVMFPTFIGFLIIYSFKNIFDYSFESLIEFLFNHPRSITLGFFTIGIIFMIEFSTFVLWLRNTIRPGVLFFIRNPNDPNFRPISELVDRPLTQQLQRFYISSLIYSSVILILFGLSFKIISLINPFNIFPLSLNNFSLPYEDWFVHLAIPFLLKRLNLKYFLKSSFTFILRKYFSFLSLSSYFYGGRFLNEENENGSFVFVPSFDFIYDKTERRNITNRKVSNVYLKRYQLDTKYSDPEPLNSFSPIPDISWKKPSNFKKIRERYTIVYRPNNFKLRIISFHFLLWLSWICSIFSTFVLPLALGRSLIFNLTGQNSSDIPSLLLGQSILISIASIIYKFPRGLTLDQLFSTLVKSSKVIANYLYAFVFLGLVIPVLAGLSLKLLFMKQDVMSLYLVSVLWIMGAIVCHFIYNISPFLINHHPFFSSVNNLRNVDSLNIRDLNSSIIFPSLVFLSSSILTPYLFAFTLHLVLELPLDLYYTLLRYSYLAFYALFPAYKILNMGFQSFERLIKTVRDDEYLVGKTLVNLERSISAR
ncbi:hypothetical protein O9G_001875 [Rozella allomycis CSF55]|uniref:RING-type E3 ubiquitin transferase n=1 Tax=Rozella allomycis (strain CSF55) TaxID=988480 RepID=A0A075AZX7_ROZAC|nr:hypothetical protein O9G_001875 [Rozella allomycis CSF55]|eukprot:EPZ34262.1 hypothetical protein O9G_001875 [Rozella allomycis CSF55]